MTNTNLMARLRKHARVSLVDDERRLGNGILVTLKAGWTFDALTDNRVSGADTVADAIRMVETAKPYTGSLDP